MFNYSARIAYFTPQSKSGTRSSKCSGVFSISTASYQAATLLAQVMSEKRTFLIIAGTAAAGAGAVLAYWLYKKQLQAKEPVTLSVTVETAHTTYLDQVSEKFTAGDKQEALQAIVAYCMRVSSDSAVEEEIFKKVRCNTCGKKEKTEYVATLSQEQSNYLDKIVGKHDIGGGPDKVLRVMFEYVITDVEDSVVFG